jgi:hypothetical protein
MMFAHWCCTEINPLTGQPYFACQPEAVDDAIYQDFKTLGTDFLDKYRDILTKYCASLSDMKNNTVVSYMGSVKSFFSFECGVSIKLPRGTIPSPELAVGEHELTLADLQAMHAIASWEGKARISTALLGWGVSDFLALKVKDIKRELQKVDADGFVAFTTDRIKTRKHSVMAVGVLTPEAVEDLTKYLSTIPSSQEYLWTTRTPQGINDWLKSLVEKAGIIPTGRIRFHSFRKFMFTIAEASVDTKFAKLIIGKKINYSDLTYSTGLVKRVLQHYKQKVYPQVQLISLSQNQQDLQAQMHQQTQEIHELKTSLYTLQNQNVGQGQQLHTLQEQFLHLQRSSYKQQLTAIYLQQQVIVQHIRSLLTIYQDHSSPALKQQIQQLYQRGLALHKQQQIHLEQIEQTDPTYLQHSPQMQAIFGDLVPAPIQILTELGFALPASAIQQLQQLLKAT